MHSFLSEKKFLVIPDLNLAKKVSLTDNTQYISLILVSVRFSYHIPCVVFSTEKPHP